MHEQSEQISIWFFIGLLLTIYGVLITAAGIMDYITPAANPVTLSELHSGIWWGAVLFVLGLIYVSKFRPRRNAQ